MFFFLTLPLVISAFYIGQPLPRMLGFSGGRATRESAFGSIPGGKYGMDQVECRVRHSAASPSQGDESSLLACRHQPLDDCGPGEAAGVVCREGNFPTNHSEEVPAEGPELPDEGAFMSLTAEGGLFLTQSPAAHMLGPWRL